MACTSVPYPMISHTPPKRRRAVIWNPRGVIPMGYGNVVHVDTWAGVPFRYTIALDAGGEVSVWSAWVHLDPIEAPAGNVIPLWAAGTRPMRTGGAA